MDEAQNVVIVWNVIKAKVNLFKTSKWQIPLYITNWYKLYHLSTMCLYISFDVIERSTVLQKYQILHQAALEY